MLVKVPATFESMIDMVAILTRPQCVRIHLKGHFGTNVFVEDSFSRQVVLSDYLDEVVVKWKEHYTKHDFVGKKSNN